MAGADLLQQVSYVLAANHVNTDPDVLAAGSADMTPAATAAMRAFCCDAGSAGEAAEVSRVCR